MQSELGYEELGKRTTNVDPHWKLLLPPSILLHETCQNFSCLIQIKIKKLIRCSLHLFKILHSYFVNSSSFSFNFGFHSGYWVELLVLEFICFELIKNYSSAVFCFSAVWRPELILYWCHEFLYKTSFAIPVKSIENCEGNRY